MAYKMKLNVPAKGMPHIWNISFHVGVLAESMNQRDDVELVQRLIIEIYKYDKANKPHASTIPPLTNATGQVDGLTAFNILRWGDPNRPLDDAMRISPARNGTVFYSASSVWTIAWLNGHLHQSAPQVWADLPNLCSPSLKQALLTKVSP